MLINKASLIKNIVSNLFKFDQIYSLVVLFYTNFFFSSLFLFTLNIQGGPFKVETSDKPITLTLGARSTNVISCWNRHSKEIHTMEQYTPPERLEIFDPSQKTRFRRFPSLSPMFRPI